MDRLLREYRVFAPVRKDYFFDFEEVRSSAEAVFDYTNTKIPPKKLLFPQSEHLFSYEFITAGLTIEEPAFDEKRRVIFGLRPCDARSFTFLDYFFNAEFKDVYYLRRRENTVVIALGCNKPGVTCFCTSVGGGPCSPGGSDLLFLDIGEKYVVQAVSDRGGKLLQGGDEFEEAKEDGLQAKEKVIETAESRIKTRLELAGIQEKLEQRFDDPLWGLVWGKCLGCGICTYLCPTCHCFDILDEAVNPHKGDRVRTWDSCQFPRFTLQTSGHNPRPMRKERVRQKIMDKFKYPVDSYGVLGCVGCGRCIKECPVNLDIREVINSFISRGAV